MAITTDGKGVIGGAMEELMSALDKCFEEPTIQQVTWRTAVRPSVLKLLTAMRQAEREATVERIRDRIKFARIGGNDWHEVYAPQMDWLLNAERDGKPVRG